MKTNEIKALPEFIEQLALKGVVIAFDAISTQKTCQLIVESGNHYLGALKHNKFVLRSAKVTDAGKGESSVFLSS